MKTSRSSCLQCTWCVLHMIMAHDSKVNFVQLLTTNTLLFTTFTSCHIMLWYTYIYYDLLHRYYHDSSSVVVRCEWVNADLKPKHFYLTGCDFSAWFMKIMMFSSNVTLLPLCCVLSPLTYGQISAKWAVSDCLVTCGQHSLSIESVVTHAEYVRM